MVLVQNYMTPLLEAASYVSYEAAELLLKAKADPNVLDMNGMAGYHLWSYMSLFLDMSPSLATEFCASRLRGASARSSAPYW
jgi:ankyrin repeat protein